MRATMVILLMGLMVSACGAVQTDGDAVKRIQDKRTFPGR